MTALLFGGAYFCFLAALTRPWRGGWAKPVSNKQRGPRSQQAAPMINWTCCRIAITASCSNAQEHKGRLSSFLKQAQRKLAWVLR